MPDRHKKLIGKERDRRWWVGKNGEDRVGMVGKKWKLQVHEFAISIFSKMGI
jgi:hypothetical protein